MGTTASALPNKAGKVAAAVVAIAAVALVLLAAGVLQPIARGTGQILGIVMAVVAVLLSLVTLCAGLADRQTWRVFRKVRKWVGDGIASAALAFALLPFIIVGRGIAVVFVKGRAHRGKKKAKATNGA